MKLVQPSFDKKVKPEMCNLILPHFDYAAIGSTLEKCEVDKFFFSWLD